MKACASKRLPVLWQKNIRHAVWLAMLVDYHGVVAATVGSEPRANATIEQVIVTAQKREERLQDVPISMSVLTGEDLDRSTHANLDEALRIVPGVALYTADQTNMTKITIRGVTGNSSLFNSGSVAGFYVDEAPFAFVRFPYTPNIGNIYDLERVEILRGPQGTLYGANSLNGVIRVTTQDANLHDLEFKSRVRVSSVEDGDVGYAGDAAVNIPVVPGRLAIRGVYGYAEDNGWVDQSVAPFDKDVNDTTQENFRFKVNAAPTDNLGVEFLAWLSRTQFNGGSASLDDRTTPFAVIFEQENSFDAYNLTFTYDFPNMSFTSASTYMEYQANSTGFVDLDGVITSKDGFDTDLGATMMSQEFRLVSTDEGPWRWSVGGMYRHELDTHRFQITSPGVEIVLPQFSGQEFNEYTSDSFTIFGEVTRALTSRWDLTFGLRYFDDKTSIEDITPIDPTSPLFGRKSERSSALTPRVVLQYAATDDVGFYASYGQGFRPGFTQGITILKIVPEAPEGVEPDRLYNYEIGSKGTLFGGRLHYDVAAYYVDWQDTVQYYVTVFSNTITAPAAFNSEGIAGPGLDVALNLQVNERLILSGNISWNDLEHVADVVSGAPGNPVLIPEGTRPSDSSPLTAGAGLQYTFPMFGQYTGILSGSVNHMQALTANEASGDDLTVVRAAFTVEAPANWTATLFVDNLTDEDGRIRPGPKDFPFAISDHPRPRTIGLQLDYGF